MGGVFSFWEADLMFLCVLRGLNKNSLNQQRVQAEDFLVGRAAVKLLWNIAVGVVTLCLAKLSTKCPREQTPV